MFISQIPVYMLSSELAMLLSGRCKEFKMRLFSFHDYMAKEEAFAEFMKTGGIPFVTVMNRTEKIDQYQEGIYNSAIVKENFMFEIEEDKPTSKSSDTSDTAIVTFYAIGVIAAVAVAGTIIRNRMH